MIKVYVFGTRGFPNVQGGVEKHCDAIYHHLSSMADITVFRRRSYVSPDTNCGAVRFIDLPSGRIKGLEALYHSFLCAIVCILRRPDIVHIHNIGPGVFTPFLRLFGLNVVLTYHSANYEHSKWGRLSKYLLRLSEKISLRWADKIIFVSEYRMNLQPEKIKKKSVWIPNGVGNFTATTSTDYIDSIGLGGCRYILSVGRITPEKGFLDLVRAFNKMNDKTGVKLVIAGGVEYETCYMSRLKAESGDDVIYTGEVSFENLEQLYSHTSLLVISSYNEEAPLVPLEAMSCNAQLLMSNLPATRCFGLPDNCYFKAGNVDELSSMMTYRLSAEPIKCTLDLQRYKWCNIADKVFEVYKSVTNAI